MGGSTPATAGADQVTRVIVRAEPGSLPAVGDAAVALGGQLVSSQHSLSTVVVDMPDRAVGRLRASVGVETVTADSRVKLQDTGIIGDVTSTVASLVGPTGLPGDMTNVTKLTGAQTFWKNGYTGQGIDVALLDSGILPVNGLTTPNKLVLGPDLSLESQVSNLRHLDTFGHGTHMAGIIAGRDSGTTPSTYTTDNTHFLGMAPGSRLVSLKLADAHGSTDVSQVIAAIDWIIEHGQKDGLNIRVLNLSFGTDSAQDYRLDPLAHATEVAWSRGVVVVVSAGNGDGTRLGLANPAYDPAVLAVGAQNTQGTADRADDTVPAFSQRGATALGMRGPDLVAPGSSIVSLRAPGSFVDSTRPGGMVATRFFKGSGTSQSAAVVSGAAALLLSQRPYLSPDQVKDLLRRSAKPLAGYDTDAQGAGALDLTSAYWSAGRTMPALNVNAGGGSLDKARGRFKLKVNGVALAGERDILGNPVTPADLNVGQDGDVLNGATWAGGGWLGPVSGGATWTGATWAGATWAGATWAGATWAGADWEGATWAGATWAGATWAGATWAGATWADAQWANDLWSSAGWE
ncbi:MAG: S8 family serine peptidase [Sporichthyaceae bacterium]